MERLALADASNGNDPHGESPQNTSAKPLSAEDRKRRELLLQQYGYSQLDEMRETADGEVEIVYKAPSLDDHLALLERNDNADKIRQAELKKREQSKLQHQQKVQRDKELLELDRQRKDKERLRTQKREKRRM